MAKMVRKHEWQEIARRGRNHAVIGTKVLKDGDTVEVDANKGVVKKI